MLFHFSHAKLFVALWTVACQAPLPMGILQVRILEWVAMLSSKASSQGLLHCRWILYQLSYQGSPYIQLYYILISTNESG